MTFVAIDGPGGAGKSTLARALAARLGLERLDTGAMYRAVTLLVLRQGVDPDDAERVVGIAGAATIEVTGGDKVLVDGEDLTTAIRSPTVDGAVSKVAAHPGVRQILVERQRAWARRHGGGVVEGRDIGSVVLPDADLKVYLTADHAVRAVRRAAQVGDGGDAAPDAGAIAAAISRRDRLDSGRTHSPLVVAPGAVVVDSTDRSVGDIVNELVKLLEAGSADEAGSSATVEPRVHSGTLGSVAGRPIRRSELAFYAACRLVAVGSSRGYFPGKVDGAERLPTSGAYVLAPVHRSYVDWLVVARVTRRRLRYLVKDEVWKVKAVGRLIELLGAFPVRRGSADREAFETAIAVLQGGEPLVVFPEGTRSSGPTIGVLRDGAAYLALRAGVPIVPVGIGGTECSMPRGKHVPRPVRVRLVVGEPLDPRDFLEPGRDDPIANVTGARRRSKRIPRSATQRLSAALRESLQAVFNEAEGRVAARGSRAGAAAQPEGAAELQG